MCCQPTLRVQKRGIAAAAKWAEDEIRKHIAYYSASDLDRYDALQLGYAMAIVDFVGAAAKGILIDPCWRQV